MYKKILALVDDATYSETGARYAQALAASCNASLSLMFIAEPGIDTKTFKRAEGVLERLFMENTKTGMMVESIIENGELMPTLTSRIKKDAIDIVFFPLGRHMLQRGIFRQALIRSLLRSVPCSLALTRIVHMARPHPHNILVPLGGKVGEIAEWSYFLCTMHEAFRSKVILYHLATPFRRIFSAEKHHSYAELSQFLSKDILKLEESIRHCGIPVHNKIAKGTIGRSIIIEAASRRNDLVIMGGTGRSLLQSLLYGNPMMEVLRETPCNTIIFKPGKHPKRFP